MALSHIKHRNHRETRVWRPGHQEDCVRYKEPDLQVVPPFR